MLGTIGVYYLVGLLGWNKNVSHYGKS